jgi:hypothetical protein
MTSGYFSCFKRSLACSKEWCQTRPGERKLHCVKTGNDRERGRSWLNCSAAFPFENKETLIYQFLYFKAEEDIF